MNKILGISDAASLGLHAMIILAQEEDDTPLSVRELAGRLDASGAHLGKVMQRLGKSGLVESRRGPGGGFRLARLASEVTLLSVYEAIEGDLPSRACLLPRSICDGQTCVLGGLLQSVGTAVRRYLSNRRLSDFRDGHRLGNLDAAWVSHPVKETVS